MSLLWRIGAGPIGSFGMLVAIVICYAVRLWIGVGVAVLVLVARWYTRWGAIGSVRDDDSKVKWLTGHFIASMMCLVMPVVSVVWLWLYS